MGSVRKPMAFPYSRTQLENLSTGELIELAENLGIDIPRGLERIFIIEELLLESASLSESKPQDDLQVNPSNIDSVALPKQYNITFIEVIIRDPLWAYVFWEVKTHDREMHENAPNFGGYFLQVIPLEEDGAAPKSNENSFTVLIRADDNAKYLGFAEQSHKEAGCYAIKLGVIRGEVEYQLALSQPFVLPKLIDDDYFTNTENDSSTAAGEKNKTSPLMRLSGMHDFLTVKNKDRRSRVKRN